MANNAVAIVNQALAKLGSLPIQSLDDTTPAGQAVKLAYWEVTNGLLTEVPWSFTLMMVALTATGEVSPDADPYLAEGYRNSYALPAIASAMRPDLAMPLLAPPIAYFGDPRRADWPERDVLVLNKTIYANRSPLWARVQARPDESEWPPYFVTAAVACLAAELVMPISGNSGLLQSKQEEAWGTPEENRSGGKLGLAKRIDARAHGSKKIRQNPLIDCRY